MKRYRITVDGHTYEVDIDDSRARPVTAHVAGEVFQVEVETEGPPSIPAGGEAAAPVSRPSARSQAPVSAPVAAAGQQLLTAPIPGTVTKITAAPGQVIQRGDPLITLEAMKMFNVIRSPWAGTVVAVHVSESQHVTQGELLMTLATNA